MATEPFQLTRFSAED